MGRKKNVVSDSVAVAKIEEVVSVKPSEGENQVPNEPAVAGPTADMSVPMLSLAVVPPAEAPATPLDSVPPPEEAAPEDPAGPTLDEPAPEGPTAVARRNSVPLSVMGSFEIWDFEVWTDDTFRLFKSGSLAPAWEVNDGGNICHPGSKVSAGSDHRLWSILKHLQ